MSNDKLASIIDQAFEGRDRIGPKTKGAVRKAVNTALELLDRERFDAVLLDLNLPPIDSWLVLAALGHRSERPRIVVAVGNQNEVERAQALGADVCVVAGTTAPARALTSAWQRHQRTSRPTPSSVSA